MLVGITGYAQHGKSTVAKYLAHEYGFELFAFADPLRQFLLAQNPWIVDVAHPLFNFTAIRLKDLVDAVGWDEAKKIPEVRRLMQATGTEAGRQIIGDSVWIDLTIGKASGARNGAIQDVRFPNESDAVHAAGGVRWRIERPNFDNGVDKNHPSEAFIASLPVDIVLINDGTVKDLCDKVDYLVSGAAQENFKNEVRL